LLTIMQGQDVPAICRELDELEDLDPAEVQGSNISLRLQR
jgi:hypothetical protein